MIVWKQVFKQMRQLDAKENPVPFSIEVIKADRQRRRAGEILKLSAVTLSGIRPTRKSTRHKERLREIITGKKNPHHNENATLNIYDPMHQRTIKIHTRLITRFNGQTVIY